MDERTIQERFDVFHAANPEIYTLFWQYARRVRDAGHKRYSADAILHRIRWHMDVEVNDTGEAFKINDHFSSRYARLMVERNPSFEGFFVLRELRRE